MYLHSFKDLIVWQKAMDLVKEIYKITKSLPKEEMYGLTSQMRRAAISIPSNIAEGKKRKTKNDFLHFLRTADGSAAELETQLLVTNHLYSDIGVSQAMSLLEEVQKMLATIINKLETSNS
jgi:four helix bundle protein